MKNNELSIGDWVYYSRCNKTPMRVKGIFNDDTIFLDFEGNEGGIFEQDIRDIAPIYMTRKIAEKNGFKTQIKTISDEFRLEFWYCKRRATDNLGHKNTIFYEKGGRVVIKNWNLSFKMIESGIEYVHQFQGILRRSDLADIADNFKV